MPANTNTESMEMTQQSNMVLAQQPVSFFFSSHPPINSAVVCVDVETSFLRGCYCTVSSPVWAVSLAILKSWRPFSPVPPPQADGVGVGLSSGVSILAPT